MMPAINSRSHRLSSKVRPTDYILAGPSSFPSARVLRDAIEKLTGKHYLITNKPGIATNAIARYGGNITVPGIETPYNSINLIGHLSNKLHFAGICIELGLNAPDFHTGGEPTEYPVLVRETLTGFGGAGIHVCNTQSQFRQTMRRGWFWVPFYHMDSEYRVHVANGQILRIFEKVPTSDLGPTPIRNNESCHFSLLAKPRCGETMRKAVATLCADPRFSQGFFALDMGWDAKNKKLIIIEGNSAPGLNENTAEMYARAILGMPQQAVLEPMPVIADAPMPVNATPRPARPVTAGAAAAEAINRINREAHDHQAGVERSSNEVLRPVSNTPGVGVPSTGNQKRPVNKPVDERPFWER
jgi:hypothetical protein